MTHMHLHDPLTGRLRSARAHPFGVPRDGGDDRADPVDAGLHRQLPDHHTAKHWNLAWAGFDVTLCVALGVTAWAR